MYSEKHRFIYYTVHQLHLMVSATEIFAGLVL